MTRPDPAVVRVDEVCPECGEPVDVHARINSADAGVLRRVCSAACGYVTPWEADRSVKPYLDKHYPQ